jgi:hypothetical protein
VFGNCEAKGQGVSGHGVVWWEERRGSGVGVVLDKQAAPLVVVGGG